MALTPEEQRELDQLESEIGSLADNQPEPSATGLTSDEQKELDSLESEFSNQMQNSTIEEPTSKLKSALLAAQQGLTLNHADEAKNWIYQKLLQHAGLPDDPEYLAKVRQEYEKAQKDNPWTSGIFQVAGAALPWLTGIGEGMGAIEAGSVGVGMGALNRTGMQDVNPEDKSVKEAIIDHPIATIADFAIPASLNKLGTAARPENLEQKAGEKLFKSLGGQKSQTSRALGKRIDVENVSDIGNAAADKGIVTPFSSPKEMAENAENLRQSGWDKMKGVFQEADKDALESGSLNPYEGTKGLVSKQSIMNDIRDNLSSQYDPKEIESLIEHINRNSSNSTMTLEEAQALKNSLNKQSGWGSLNPTTKNLASRDMENIIADNINSSVLKKSKSLPVLEEGRSDYAVGSDAQKLLRNRVAGEMGNKTLGLTDWMSLMMGMGPNGELKVPLLYGGKKYLETFGNQQTGLGLRFLNKMQGGKPVLEKGIKSVGQGLGSSQSGLFPNVSLRFKKAAQDLSTTDNEAASNYMMSERDPTYRQGE